MACDGFDEGSEVHPIPASHPDRAHFTHPALKQLAEEVTRTLCSGSVHALPEDEQCFLVVLLDRLCLGWEHLVRLPADERARAIAAAQLSGAAGQLERVHSLVDSLVALLTRQDWNSIPRTLTSFQAAVDALARFSYGAQLPGFPRLALHLPDNDYRMTVFHHAASGHSRLELGSLGGSLVARGSELAHVLCSGERAGLSFADQIEEVTLAARLLLIPFKYTDAVAARAGRLGAFVACRQTLRREARALAVGAIALDELLHRQEEVKLAVNEMDSILSSTLHSSNPCFGSSVSSWRIRCKLSKFKVMT